MSTVKVAKLRPQAGKSRPRNVGKTVGRSSTGRIMDIFTLKADSPTFGSDLTYVYRANVASARRENEKLLGSADGFRTPARRVKSSGSSNGARKK